MAERYLPIENPDNKGTVDFLSEGVSVTVTIRDGALHVAARMSHGEEASTWDEHEITWHLPEKP